MGKAPAVLSEVWPGGFLAKGVPAELNNPIKNYALPPGADTVKRDGSSQKGYFGTARVMLGWLTQPRVPSLQQQQPLRLLRSHAGAGRGAEPVEHPARRDPHGGGRRPGAVQHDRGQEPAGQGLRGEDEQPALGFTEHRGRCPYFLAHQDGFCPILACFGFFGMGWR